MAKALFSSFSFCNTANKIGVLHALANWPRTFAGEDAKWQPPDLADVFMHETVASWVRQYFKIPCPRCHVRVMFVYVGCGFHSVVLRFHNGYNLWSNWIPTGQSVSNYLHKFRTV